MDNKDRIRRWLESGKQRRSSYVIVAYNANEKDFRPIYVSPNQNIRSRIKDINEDYILKPVEVYNLSMDIDKQLLQRRAWNT